LFLKIAWSLSGRGGRKTAVIAFVEMDIDFSEHKEYNCLEIKYTPCLTTGWGLKEVQDFTVGTAH